MNRLLQGTSIALLAAYALPAVAEVSPEYPGAVSTFQQACLIPGFDPAERAAAIAGLPGWKEDPVVSVDSAKFDISKAIEHNYSFAKVSGARQWSGTIDGKPAMFVLAALSGKVRYPNLCALVLSGVANAMPYGGPLRDAFKAYGVGSKSVDLVHYYEFAGKVGADKHPVRGEVFSRSLVGSTKDTMHIYVAF